MSLFSSTQIIVNSLNVALLQQSKETALGSSPVLETLLPELSVWQTRGVRQKQKLENIDAYMLQETRLILNRVRSFCSSLILTHPTIFNIKLQTRGSNATLLITGTCEEKEKLTKLINQDSWLTAAFHWLCPNYSALAHSQELSTFSYAYKKNRRHALHQYKHFEQKEQGMRCFLACDMNKGELNLTWCLQSPKTVYVLEEL